jgi:hypothetical protein
MDDAIKALDRYLLAGEGEKANLVERLLAARSGEPAAAPFRRMLEAVGERVPDDALLAFRIALSGRTPDDGDVLDLRSAVRAARSHAAGTHESEEARARYARTLAGD